MASEMSSSGNDNMPCIDAGFHSSPQHEHEHEHDHDHDSERGASQENPNDALPVTPPTAAAATAPASPTTPRIRPHPTQTAHYITVTDPTPQNDGLLGRHTTVYYRVAYHHSTERPHPPDAAPFLPRSAETQHRYSSFLALSRTLSRRKPGIFLPPLAEKSVRSAATPERLERRRFELELFLRRCVLHPELRTCGALRAFFGEEGRSAGPDDDEDEDEDENHDDDDADDDRVAECAAPKTTGASKTKSLQKWIREKKTTWAGGTTSLHRSPLDPLFDEMERYVAALETALKRVEIQAEQMVKHCEKEESVWTEFGSGCDAVGRVEDVIGSNSARTDLDPDRRRGAANAFRATSAAAAELSALRRTHRRALLRTVLLPARDHLKRIRAAKTAIDRRSRRRVAYAAALSRVRSKKMQWHKYRMAPGCENKIAPAERSLREAEGEAGVAEARYREVTERVLREFDRFRRENSLLMRETAVEFGRVQAEFWEEVARVWRGCVEEMEDDGVMGMKDGAGDGPSFVERARKLMMEGTGSDGVGGRFACDGPGNTSDMPIDGNGSMPLYPPLPVPAEREMNGLVNGIESLGIHGTVRYRDPLPEE